MKDLGMIGQEVFDMLVENQSLEEIEEHLYAYLPSEFGRPGDSYAMENNSGGNRKLDIEAHAYRLAPSNAPEGISIPEWTDHVNAGIWFRLRFKPQKENRAIMLNSIRVSLSAESSSIPAKHEQLFEHVHKDIDEAIDDVLTLVKK